MIGRLDRDESEAKKCYDDNYGKKFKSYRIGFHAGKRDGREKGIEKREKCPYIIPSEILALLKKRARWFMGYEAGWEEGRKKKRRRE